MKEKLALLLGMVLCATMTFSVSGLAWAQPHKKPEPPKKRAKVCLRWTEIVKWPDPEHEEDSAASATDLPDPGYYKIKRETEYLWKKANAAYAYQAHSPRVFAYGDDPSIKGIWKLKVLKKLTKQECLGKNPKDPENPYISEDRCKYFTKYPTNFKYGPCPKHFKVFKSLYRWWRR